MENRYYVYWHKNPNTGEVFYVGMGTGYRAKSFCTRGRNRNEDWIAYVDSNGIPEVGYYAKGLSKEGAKELEESIIDELRPCCNVKIGMKWGGSENTPWIGRHHSKESKLKVRDAKGGRQFSQYTKDGIWVADWDTNREAGDSLKIDYSSIGKCLRGERDSAGGYIWEYKK
jgi:hypothetical protein